MSTKVGMGAKKRETKIDDKTKNKIVKLEKESEALKLKITELEKENAELINKITELEKPNQ